MNKVLLHIFLLVCLLSPVFSVKAQVNAEQMTNIGRNVLAMDDYVLAIQYFNHAVAAKPYLWDPYYFRALAKLMLDDFHGAEQDASSAIERNKYKYEAYRVRGFARLRAGADSAAITDFDRGLAYSPDDRYFLYYKGIAQGQGKQLEQADSTLSRLLNLYPHFDYGLEARAKVRLMMTDTTQALTDANRALALNPSMQNPRFIIADVLLSRRDWKGASLQLDSIISLLPTEPDLYVNRAYARYNADDWTGAMDDYNYALDLDPQNYAATYNRALLRFQIQDLEGAMADFGRVLEKDPADFPARYNRALILLELGRWRQAIKDLQEIERRFPKFYPVYYAMARAHQGLGNQKAAADLFFKANDMIGRYVANPRAYALDRPTIQRGSSREEDKKDVLAQSETPEQVMEHFNELVTVSQSHQSTPQYGDKLRGRVQDIDIRVQAEPPLSVSLIDPSDELHPRSATTAELSQINNSGWLPYPLFLVSATSAPAEEAEIEELFNRLSDLDAAESAGPLRPVDLLARAVILTTLKDYDRAMADLDKAIAMASQFPTALLQRAYLNTVWRPSADADPMLKEAQTRSHLEQAEADYKHVIDLDQRNAPAYMGRAYILYLQGDFSGAAAALSQALEHDPALGPAYYNRALCRLRLGRKQEASEDLSRAGAAGYVQAYNLLKKL